jgi:hypothetical protein
MSNFFKYLCTTARRVYRTACRLPEVWHAQGRNHQVPVNLQYDGPNRRWNRNGSQ